MCIHSSVVCRRFLPLDADKDVKKLLASSWIYVSHAWGCRGEPTTMMMMMRHTTGQLRRIILLLLIATITCLLFTSGFLGNVLLPSSASINRSLTYENRALDYEAYSTPGKCGTIVEGGWHWQAQLAYRARHALVAGKRPNGTKHLILGIASVYREENYLYKTLSSLIKESDADERKDVTVIVYLADASSEKNSKQLESIKKSFPQYIQSGFLQVIMSSADIYPPMDFAATKRTFNDSTERVLWRTKQVIDFTFLFTYAQSQGEYYLVVEDDVVASTQYITAIREFIATRNNKRWVSLQFTGFLGIGLLFRTTDLPKLTQLLWMFHQEQPVDMLMREFINLQVPEPNLIVRRIPSIFQHIGVKSSLHNKVQKLTDSTFNMANRKHKNRNPSADLVTTMKVYNDFVPEYAYRAAPGFFWGIAKFNDTFDIVFPTPINITRIVIITGIVEAKKKLKDSIRDGILEIGDKFQRIAPSNNAAMCDNFRRVQNFHDGILDLSTQGSIQCVRVRIGQGQKSWVIIREIEIFSKMTAASGG